MSKGLTLISLIAFLMLVSCFDYGSNVEPEDYEFLEDNYSFGRKDNINITNVSGDCIIEKSTDDSIRVKLEYYFEPANCFKAQYIEENNKLILKEVFNGSCSGSSKWTITTPAGVNINFMSASGDFEARGLDGVMDIKTASGDVDIKESSGTYQVATASGDIGALNVLLQNVASFSTASGDICVTLSKSAEHDVSVSSASGKAIMDYNGNAVEGFFEFTAKVNGGRIISPFAFDHEETFTDIGQLYYRKSFSKVKSTPKVVIRTASGTAELRN